jgi:hypothetical protein
VILFNWKDSLQVDRILNLLAVFARAARGIKLTQADGSNPFGHLHLYVALSLFRRLRVNSNLASHFNRVFRDWCFAASTPEEVYRDLFTSEVGGSDEVEVRNSARSEVIVAFESITVWLLPVPVERAASLKEALHISQLSESFTTKLHELRGTLLEQLKRPTTFHGQSVTARLLLRVVPTIANTLNDGQVVVPESIYLGIVRTDAKRIRQEVRQSVLSIIQAQVATDAWTSSEDMQRELQLKCDQAIEDGLAGMQSAPTAIARKVRDSTEQFAREEITSAVLANDEKLQCRLTKMVDNCKLSLAQNFSRIEGDIPVTMQTLEKEWGVLTEAEQSKIRLLALGCNAETELNQISAYASELLRQLEEANEAAVHALMSEAQTLIQSSFQKLLSDIDALLQESQPVGRQSVMHFADSSLVKICKQLHDFASSFDSAFDQRIQAQLDSQKVLVIDYVESKYDMVVHHILSDCRSKALEHLYSEAHRTLSVLLPTTELQIQCTVGDEVTRIQALVAGAVHGWTVRDDAVQAVYSAIADMGTTVRSIHTCFHCISHSYRCLWCVQLVKGYIILNQTHQNGVAVAAQNELIEYQGLREQIAATFQQEVEGMGLPTDDSKIDAAFELSHKTVVALFLSSKATIVDVKPLQARLAQDSKFLVENYKLLNLHARDRGLKRLAVEGISLCAFFLPQ